MVDIWNTTVSVQTEELLDSGLTILRSSIVFATEYDFAIKTSQYTVMNWSSLIIELSHY